VLYDAGLTTEGLDVALEAGIARHLDGLQAGPSTRSGP